MTFNSPIPKPQGKTPDKFGLSATFKVKKCNKVSNVKKEKAKAVDINTENDMVFQ